ncbi:MAG: hypothetical protein K5848_06255, partial [Lachnospiraceae bacterium]|nr:hypothetical protein [Lachnospiraceae bacterium]
MALFNSEPRKVKDFKASGIHFEELEMQQRSFKGNVLKCLWNAMLIFIMLFGRVGFFVSAFDIPASMPVLIIGFLFISFYLAFLYLNSFTYNVGYIILPVLVVIVAASMYQIANSGFSAIVNIIIHDVDKQFNLDNIREYNEFYANRTISTTVTLLLISLLLGIIINMCVSRRRSIFRPIIASLIIIELGVYLNNENFSYFYLFVLIFGCILYIYTRQNDNHEFSYKKRYKIYKVQKNAVDIRKNKVNRFAALITAVFISLAGILLAVVLSSGFSSVYLDDGSKIKEKSDVVVKNLASYGLAYYFNNGNTGNGGLNNGKVGDTGTVILTGTKYLTIDYVPYTYDEIYLPNYVGSLYDPMNNRWTKEYPNIYPTIIDSLFLYGSVSTGYDNDYYSSYNLVDDTYTLSSNILMDSYLQGLDKAAVFDMRIKNYGTPENFDAYYRYREVRNNYINTGSSSIINEVYPNNFDDEELSTLIDNAKLPKTNTSLVDLAFYLSFAENKSTGLSSELQRVIKEEGFTYSSIKEKLDEDQLREDLLEYIGKENNTEFTITFDPDSQTTHYEYVYHLSRVDDALLQMDRVKLAKEEFEIIDQLKKYYSSEFVYTLTP